jgi:N-acyl-phosphatidylethanolamine-hydrolysing phospholipase D
MNNPDTTQPPVPIHTPSFLPTRKTPTLRATWLGHACFLVEFPSGLRVLFDPVFTHRCSPYSWLGPARYTPTPCKIENIPFIDAVVISHNHYDHLSRPTVLEIKNRHPNCQFFVPLGNETWFRRHGIDNVTEMDWWGTKALKLTLMIPDGQEANVEEAGLSTNKEKEVEIDATIGCLPSQHMSARTPFDKGNTLWSSWCVESGGKKVWFAG